MNPPTQTTKPATLNPPPASGDVRAYIEDQLDALAQLAAARGERRLAVALQLAALEASRAA